MTGSSTQISSLNGNLDGNSCKSSAELRLLAVSRGGSEESLGRLHGCLIYTGRGDELGMSMPRAAVVLAVRVKGC